MLAPSARPPPLSCQNSALPPALRVRGADACVLYCMVLGYEPCRVRRVVWGVEGRPSSPMGDSVRCRRARTHVGRPSPQSGRAVEANMIWVAIDRPMLHESTYRLEHEHRYETVVTPSPAPLLSTWISDIWPVPLGYQYVWYRVPSWEKKGVGGYGSAPPLH